MISPAVNIAAFCLHLDLDAASEKDSSFVIISSSFCALLDFGVFRTNA